MDLSPLLGNPRVGSPLAWVKRYSLGVLFDLIYVGAERRQMQGEP